MGNPEFFRRMVLSFLECWNLIEQPLTFLKDKTLFPMSIFLPAIEADHAGMAIVTVRAFPDSGNDYFPFGAGIFGKRNFLYEQEGVDR